MTANSGSIFDAADRFRGDLLRRERRAASELVRYYGRIWQEINRQISKMIRDYYNTPDTERESWLYQMQRLQALRAQVESEIGRFARFADRQIQVEQREVVQAAQDHAEQLGRLGLGKGPPGVEVHWSKLPNEALRDLIGFLQDGSPLKDLLGRLGPEAGQAVMDALMRGLGLGLGPEVIGRLIQQMMGMALTRALRIARTEMLRAYREAAYRNYQANGDVVKGWIWHSALNERTCAACWAMHGTVHRLEERLDDHVCGRCTAVPLTKTWAELGFEGIPETTLPIERGVDVFQRLNPEMQQEILGAAKYAAWKDGKFGLEDLVGRKYDGRWGSMRYERSLKELLGAGAASGYVRQAQRGVSNHPVDQMIRDMIARQYTPTVTDLQRILAHIAQADFYQRSYKISKVVGQNYLGRTINAEEQGLFAHLIKRVLIEKQWAWGTTKQDYLDDLHRMVQQEGNQVGIGIQRKENNVIVFGGNGIPMERRGEEALGSMVVVYSADRGKIISGYQISSLRTVRIPEDVQWLTP